MLKNWTFPPDPLYLPVNPFQGQAILTMHIVRGCPHITSAAGGGEGVRQMLTIADVGWRGVSQMLTIADDGIREKIYKMG